jgi:YlmC/YmxH family sporulation protein
MVGGEMNRSSDFRQKEVINLSDGRRLGFVSDVELDLEEGKIDAIILPGVGKLFGILGKDNEFVIPWEKIVRIGEDVILVDLDERFMRRYFD